MTCSFKCEKRIISSIVMTNLEEFLLRKYMRSTYYLKHMFFTRKKTCHFYILDRKKFHSTQFKGKVCPMLRSNCEFVRASLDTYDSYNAFSRSFVLYISCFCGLICFTIMHQALLRTSVCVASIP
jgi:hypothetical protein